MTIFRTPIMTSDLRSIYHVNMEFDWDTENRSTLHDSITPEEAEEPVRSTRKPVAAARMRRADALFGTHQIRRLRSLRRTAQQDRIVTA
jgi:hypothetical protein